MLKPWNKHTEATDYIVSILLTFSVYQDAFMIQSNETSSSHLLLIVMVVEQIIFKKRWEFGIVFVESVSHCRKYARGGKLDNPIFNQFSNQTPYLRGMG